MDREIKFRAWIKAIGGYEMTHIDLINGSNIQWFFANNNSDNCKVMQYTGLKDKNGVEIYEGDIIKHFGDFGVVKFQKGCFVSNWKTKSTLLKDFIMGNRCEVIGNIYENPELLKK